LPICNGPRGPYGPKTDGSIFERRLPGAVATAVDAVDDAAMED
jgi:hypothetical protein